MAEVTKLENEYRLLTDGKLSPNTSPVVSAHVQSDCESEGENAMEMEGAPSRVFFAACSVLRSPAAPTGAQDLPESKRPRRSMPPDGGSQSSQPLLYGLVSNCSEEPCSALF